MIYKLCLLLVLLSSVCLGVTVTPQASITQVTIVQTSDAWLANHAAEELAHYLKQITELTPKIVKSKAETNKDKATFILALNARSELEQVAGGNDPQRVRDGYVIQSRDHQIIIAAAEPIGLLYGVYAYLEDYCGCGFFFDGDQVPRQTDLSFPEVNVKVLPRWSVRMFYNLDAGFGLDKWHHGMRSREHKEQIYDWFAKRGLNWCSRLFLPDIQSGGIAAKNVFGLQDNVPSKHLYGGWPGDLGFPAQVITDNIQHEFEYSRRRGVHWMYSLCYGRVPHQFRQSHPEYQYLKTDNYGNTDIHPDDPACEEWTNRYFSALFKTYGTDHLYDVAPYVETSNDLTPEESFNIKMVASQRLLKLLHSLDEKAVWVGSSWDFISQPNLWTVEHIKTFLNSMPRDQFKIFDSMSCSEIPYYQRTNYFEGATWWYGILHSFQGDDHLHGDLAGDIRRIRDFSHDPNGLKCEGICICPESTGHNILYYDMLTCAAWNAEQTSETYLSRYARRRYGVKDAARMYAALNALVRAVYTANGQMPVYKKIGCPSYRHDWPIVDDNKYQATWPASGAGPHPGLSGQGITDLLQAVEQGLACRESQQNNSLYENDIVDWTRTYLGHMFNWAVLNSYADFKDGRQEEMNKHIATARLCLSWIEKILSTRPDFSMQRQIDQALKVPGVNPHIDWYLKKHIINDGYASTEGYEVLHWYYRPRMEVYFHELEKRAKEGTKTILRNDITQGCQDIEQHWLEQNIEVPVNERFAGTPLEAVTAAIAALKVDFSKPK